MSVTRKEFFQTVVGAAAVASAARQNAVGAATLSSNIKPGVSLYSYTGDFNVTMTLEDCLADMAAMGANGLEILSETHVADYPNPSNSWVDHWFELLNKYNITPACYSCWVDTKLRKGRTLSVDEATEWLLRDMRLANRLGFPIMRPKLGTIDRNTLDPTWREMTERALPYAERYNIKITPEIHAPALLKSQMVDDYVDVVEKTGTEHFGLLIDTGVFATRPSRLNDRAFESEPDPDAEARRRPAGEHVYSKPEDILPLMPYVHHFHAKFWEMLDDFTEYCVPFEDIVPTLIEGGYNGYFCSEYEGPRDLYLASEQLRRQQVQLRGLLQNA